MRFRLIATSVPYTYKEPATELMHLREYIEKIKNADDSLDLPEPKIEGDHVYISLMYGSQFHNLAKTLHMELIIRIDDPEPTIEIYDSWRE